MLRCLAYDHLGLNRTIRRLSTFSGVRIILCHVRLCNRFNLRDGFLLDRFCLLDGFHLRDGFRLDRFYLLDGFHLSDSFLLDRFDWLDWSYSWFVLDYSCLCCRDRLHLLNRFHLSNWFLLNGFHLLNRLNRHLSRIGRVCFRNWCNRLYGLYRLCHGSVLSIHRVLELILESLNNDLSKLATILWLKRSGGLWQSFLCRRSMFCENVSICFRLKVILGKSL